ncbi:MAG: hypothetical protein JWN18_131 [Parcubacteria group bacterium]|nr:hypothetical protein [Parcubacteria group bacterium]
MNDIYTYTVPLFIKTLGGLKNVLAKAEAFAKEKGMSEETLLADQLAPDMFPLSRQVQMACDNAKGATARLAGVEAPKFEDTEKTFAELQTRIDKTLEFVQSVPESAFAHAADRKIVLPYFADKYLTGFDYTREYVLPNFFFHTVTAYALIRKNGVNIGKADYTNNVNFRDL